MRPLLAALALASMTCATVSCGIDTPWTPSFTFAGNWAGVAQDNIAGTGVFRATLSQDRGTVTGTWFISFPLASFQNSGSVSGSANGASLSATLTPSNPTTCPFHLTANGTGTQMSGTYASFNCIGSVAGTFSASR